MPSVSSAQRFKKFVHLVYNARFLYLLILPALIFYIVFNYYPMYGLTLAFKQFRADLGIMNSPWIGFDKFELLFRDSLFFRALGNTIVISIQRILFQFPVPIILALLMNEVKSGKLRRTMQTVFTFPNFVSWVIISGIVVNFLSSEGALNGLLKAMGLPETSFLTSTSAFRPILYISQNWKGAGWFSIIYLSAITGIEQEQYESAMIDGASRMQKILHITLPGISSTIMVTFILAAGGIMNAGFDQVFNMYNPAVYEVADIFDTYIYRITFNSATDFSFSAAVSLFKSVANFAMLIICDRVVKMTGRRGLFY